MKVFVTVGSMLPFDRLIEAMDQWAVTHPEVTVQAQIGDSCYQPKALRPYNMLTPAQYRELCGQADVIVSHVGMGTVITAAELGIPLVAMPRRKDLREVTSDHQTATARWLASRAGITIVEDANALGAAIECATQRPDFKALSTPHRDRLLSHVRQFLKASGATQR